MTMDGSAVDQSKLMQMSTRESNNDDCTLLFGSSSARNKMVNEGPQQLPLERINNITLDRIEESCSSEKKMSFLKKRAQMSSDGPPPEMDELQHTPQLGSLNVRK